MADFMDTLKDKAGKFFKSAESVTKTTIKKTSESVNTLKLNYSIKEVENSIDDICKSLGRMIYEEYKNGAEFTGEYLDNCQKIDEYYDEIEILKTKIAETNNKRLCPNCGKYNESDSKYCSDCGQVFED